MKKEHCGIWTPIIYSFHGGSVLFHFVSFQHFMTMVRKTKTCDYYQCKMSCEEWLADEISILRYSTADEYCQCFRFPYMELYNYGEAPKVDEGEIYAVTCQLNVKPVALCPPIFINKVSHS